MVVFVLFKNGNSKWKLKQKRKTSCVLLCGQRASANCRRRCFTLYNATTWKYNPRGDHVEQCRRVGGFSLLNYTCSTMGLQKPNWKPNHFNALGAVQLDCEHKPPPNLRVYPHPRLTSFKHHKRLSSFVMLGGYSHLHLLRIIMINLVDLLATQKYGRPSETWGSSTIVEDIIKFLGVDQIFWSEIFTVTWTLSIKLTPV